MKSREITRNTVRYFTHVHGKQNAISKGWNRIWDSSWAGPIEFSSFLAKKRKFVNLDKVFRGDNTSKSKKMQTCLSIDLSHRCHHLGKKCARWDVPRRTWWPEIIKTKFRLDRILRSSKKHSEERLKNLQGFKDWQNLIYLCR